LIVFLDTNVLGALVNPSPKSAEVKAMQTWALQLQTGGHLLIVPAIVDYEQRREHIRRAATPSLDALDAFYAAVPDRYLPLTESALKLAAQLWATVRQSGLPTADTKSLDCDILLAAQVLDLNLPAGSYIVATTNTQHLARVISCELWRNIIPER
jgi:predicted nucleic acid-binding protein